MGGVTPDLISTIGEKFNELDRGHEKSIAYRDIVSGYVSTPPRPSRSMSWGLGSSLRTLLAPEPQPELPHVGTIDGDVPVTRPLRRDKTSVRSPRAVSRVAPHPVAPPPSSGDADTHSSGKAKESQGETCSDSVEELLDFDIGDGDCDRHLPRVVSEGGHVRSGISGMDDGKEVTALIAWMPSNDEKDGQLGRDGGRGQGINVPWDAPETKHTSSTGMLTRENSCMDSVSRPAEVTSPAHAQTPTQPQRRVAGDRVSAKTVQLLDKLNKVGQLVVDEGKEHA